MTGSLSHLVILSFGPLVSWSLKPFGNLVPWSAGQMISWDDFDLESQYYGELVHDYKTNFVHRCKPIPPDNLFHCHGVRGDDFRHSLWYCRQEKGHSHFHFLRHRPLPSFFIIYIFFQGFDTFAGVYEHFWNDHFLYAKLEKNQCYELDALLFIKNLWNVKLAFTIDFWDKTGSTNLSQRFFPTFLLCLRSSGS